MNYDHLLAIAGDVIAEHGAGASLRDIARRAGVGLGTLYRHFPTREALLNVLLRAKLDELTQQAERFGTSDAPDEALVSWFRSGLTFTRTYAGVVALMAAALDDPESALHASCTKVRSAGGHLLELAQAKGAARPDIDGTDLFAMMGALAWIGDQPAFVSRLDHLTEVITNALLQRPLDQDTK